MIYKAVAEAQIAAVIPGYFLVWYDADLEEYNVEMAVIPGYFLVWYD